MKIPQLDFQLTADGNVELRQQNGLDEPDVIEVHQMHVRMIAEQLGLLKPLPAEAMAAQVLELTLAERDSTIDRFKRHMLRILEKAEAVQNAILKGDWDHADLSFEMREANALVELCEIAAEEFGPEEDDNLAPGVLWEGSNGGRQMDPNRSQQAMRAAVAQTGARDSMVSSGDLIAWALRQPLEKSSAKFVLFTMAVKAGGDGRFCSSTADLAAMTGQDRKTVMENIKRLSEIGLIVDTGEKGGDTKAIPIFQLMTEKEYDIPKTGQLGFEQEVATA